MKFSEYQSAIRSRCGSQVGGLTLPPPAYPSFAEFKRNWEYKNKKQLNDNIHTDSHSIDDENSD